MEIRHLLQLVALQEETSQPWTQTCEGVLRHLEYEISHQSYCDISEKWQSSSEETSKACSPSPIPCYPDRVPSVTSPKAGKHLAPPSGLNFRTASGL